MTKEFRFTSHPEDAKKYDTEELRKHFHISELLVPGDIVCVYSMYDRFVTMGVMPTAESISLPAFPEYTKADFFLERRELGVINIGGKGSIEVDGTKYEIDRMECLYVGMGAKEVVFSSTDPANPSEYYINSAPAHHAYPTKKAMQSDANQVDLGSKENANERTIFQYIHEGGIQSCQLVMGYTQLKEGSVWNTFPPHTHHRRMEVYFYFDLPADQLVMHFMGEATQTRHLTMKNKEAVISPEWSIHSGAGTSAYTFIWGMAGENKAFTDMDGISLQDLR